METPGGPLFSPAYAQWKGVVTPTGATKSTIALPAADTEGGNDIVPIEHDGESASKKQKTAAGGDKDGTATEIGSTGSGPPTGLSPALAKMLAAVKGSA